MRDPLMPEMSIHHSCRRAAEGDNRVLVVARGWIAPLLGCKSAFRISSLSPVV